MTYIFGNRNAFTPAPHFKLDADDKNFTVTHIKSGILHSTVSQDSIRRRCKESFEGVSQMLLQCVYFDKSKSNDAALVDSHSVVEFTDAAVDAINKIAHQNLRHKPLYRGGKF